MEPQSAPADDAVGWPIFQVHPTRRCNLACAHCYSASSPSQRDQLDTAVILGAIEDAAALGYKVLSVSGGEPLLYAGLPDLLRCARACGMRTQLVTNGWLIPSRRFADVAALVDLIAVSVDGLGEDHNRMRGSPLAFQKVERALAHLRDLGQRFGIIHTVTDENWDKLFTVAEYARAAGAGLFQLHMLEGGGSLAHRPTGALAATRAFIIAAVLKADFDGDPPVHIDLLHSGFPFELCDGRNMTRVIDILVLEADGTVVPFTHGFSRAFTIAEIGKERLSAGWKRFAAGRYGDLLRVRRDTAESLRERSPAVLFNWQAELAATVAAKEASSPLPDIYLERA